MEFHPLIGEHMSLEQELLDEVHKAEAVLEADAKKVENLVVPQAEEEVQQVEADVAGDVHIVEADAKPVEAAVEDVVAHPVDAPEDVAKVVADVTADVPELEADIKEEGVQVAEQVAKDVTEDVAAVLPSSSTEAWANRLQHPVATDLHAHHV